MPEIPKWFDSFLRIHERPWIYVAALVVPLFGATVGLAVYGEALSPLAVFCAFALFNDALWRHRMHEIRRRGEEEQRAIARKFDRRQRVLARAGLDAEYARRLQEAMAVQGDAALDEFPLPGRN